MNNVCTLARAPGGQMQGAATQAMRCHRRGAATPQMPARRRAPSGCGPQARWLRCSLLTYNPVCSSLAPCQRAWGPAAKCKRYSLTGPKRHLRHGSHPEEVPENSLDHVKTRVLSFSNATGSGECQTIPGRHLRSRTNAYKAADRAPDHNSFTRIGQSNSLCGRMGE